MTDEEKRQALEDLWEQRCKAVPCAWRYPEKWGVKGYMGVSSTVIVSAEPSTDTVFTSPQAKEYYHLLAKHRQENAHLMDVYFVNMEHHMIGGDSQTHAQACKAVFQRQIDIIEPTLAVVMDRSSNPNRPYAGFLGIVKEWLSDMAYKGRLERIYHYTHLGSRGRRIGLSAAAWEEEFVGAVAGKP